MRNQDTRSIATFMHDLETDGVRGALTAVANDLALKSNVPDGMFPQNCMKHDVSIHLPATLECPAFAQTVTIPWQVLERALVHDRETLDHETELDLNMLLMAPIVRQLMLADGVSESTVLRAIAHIPREGEPANATTER